MLGAILPMVEVGLGRDPGECGFMSFCPISPCLALRALGVCPEAHIFYLFLLCCSQRSARSPEREALSENAAMVRAKLHGGNDFPVSNQSSATNLPTSSTMAGQLSPGFLSPLGRPSQTLQSPLQPPTLSLPKEAKRAAGADDGSFSSKPHTPYASVVKPPSGSSGTSDAEIIRVLKVRHSQYQRKYTDSRLLSITATGPLTEHETLVADGEC